MNMFASAHPQDGEWVVNWVVEGAPIPRPVIDFGGYLNVHLENSDSLLKLATALQEAHFDHHNPKTPTT